MLYADIPSTLFSKCKMALEPESRLDRHILSARHSWGPSWKAGLTLPEAGGRSITQINAVVNETSSLGGS